MRAKILIGAVALIAVGSCTGNAPPEEMIKGSDVNREAYPNYRGTGGSGPDVEAIKGNRANPEYLNQMEQQPSSEQAAPQGSPGQSWETAPAKPVQ